jgi:hypothetical protein
VPGEKNRGNSAVQHECCAAQFPLLFSPGTH